jgi:hypothetical protein
MATPLDRYYKNLNRQGILPKTSLSSAGFTPAGFEATTFTPQKEDMSLLQRSLQTLDERKEKTDQQRAAIMSALGNLKLGPEEDKWKADYANRIAKRIDAAAQFGDYSAALEEATRMAGEALSSPEVTSRVRYHEAREKWLTNLENRAARGEIDSDTLARARYENAYNYQDTYDDNGNIIGGTAWNATFEPVKDLNLSQVMAEIKSLVTPSSKATSGKGGTSQVYLDAQGNQTTDASKARGVFSTVSGGGSSHSETGVTAQQWADAYDAWVRMHPEAARQFEQKRQNNIWLYKQDLMRSQDMNLSAEERANAKANADIQYSQLTDEQGGFLSAENYARSIANPMFKVMQYSKTADSSEGGSTLFNEQIGKNRLAGEILGLNTGQAEIYGMSSPIEQLAILKDVASNAGALTDAGKQALNLLQQNFGGSTYNYTAPWQQK